MSLKLYALEKTIANLSFKEAVIFCRTRNWTADVFPFLTSREGWTKLILTCNSPNKVELLISVLCRYDLSSQEEFDAHIDAILDGVSHNYGFKFQRILTVEEWNDQSDGTQIIDEDDQPIIIDLSNMNDNIKSVSEVHMGLLLQPYEELTGKNLHEVNIDGLAPKSEHRGVQLNVKVEIRTYEEPFEDIRELPDIEYVKDEEKHVVTCFAETLDLEDIKIVSLESLLLVIIGCIQSGLEPYKCEIERWDEIGTWDERINMIQVEGLEGLRTFLVENLVNWHGWGNPLVHAPEVFYNEFDDNQITIFMSDHVTVMRINFYSIRIFTP